MAGRALPERPGRRPEHRVLPDHRSHRHHALVRSELPLRSAVFALVLGPLVIPQIVTALGLFLLFEPAAMLGSPLAIALGHTVLASPIAVLILIATLRGIDERLGDAAASMGAGRLTIARKITFANGSLGAEGDDLLVVRRGEGPYVDDTDGRRYIDDLSGPMSSTT